MGRELFRVPMDFDAPINEIWPGYLAYCKAECEEVAEKDLSVPAGDDVVYSFEGRRAGGNCLYAIETDAGLVVCPDCKGRGRTEEWRDPPEGDGYQMWETTSEGSPQSPVFATLDELCEWCAENATTFADFRATAEQWKSMLGDENNFVHAKCGRFIFC